MQYESKVGVDNLFATSTQHVVSDVLLIAKAGVLKRGTLLTAEGAVVKSTTTGDGDSAVTTYDDVYAVLAEDVDTTEAAKEAAVYLTGEFNEKALTVAAGGKVSDFKKSARKVCIFIKPCM